MNLSKSARHFIVIPEECQANVRSKTRIYSSNGQEIALRQELSSETLAPVTQVVKNWHAARSGLRLM